MVMLVSCNGWGTELKKACTTLPCPTGLRVKFDATPMAPYSVAARVSGYAPWVIECTVQAPCDYIAFPDFTPASVDIIYTASDTIITQHFFPQYEVTYPNGKDCGECRHATLNLSIAGNPGS
jgi:hypothetical protein